ncbi:unnamed protein product [Acidocella sp. C78]|nr:unnamed protein product [Acidocella sp. C78]
MQTAPKTYWLRSGAEIFGLLGGDQEIDVPALGCKRFFGQKGCPKWLTAKPLPTGSTTDSSTTSKPVPAAAF